MIGFAAEDLDSIFTIFDIFSKNLLSGNREFPILPPRAVMLPATMSRPADFIRPGS